MKLLLTFLALVLTATSAFQPALRNGGSLTELTAIKNPMGDVLRKLTNNFEPIHGHGSLEDDLEEQWVAQQELLKERKRKNIDKEHLKQKYKDPKARESFDQNVGSSPSKKKSARGKKISP